MYNNILIGYRDLHEQGSPLRELLRMSDMLQGTDKGGPDALLALGTHTRPVSHLPSVTVNISQAPFLPGFLDAPMRFGR